MKHRIERVLSLCLTIALFISLFSSTAIAYSSRHLIEYTDIYYLDNQQSGEALLPEMEVGVIEISDPIPILQLLQSEWTDSIDADTRKLIEEKYENYLE
jgi:hypothetical protein